MRLGNGPPRHVVEPRLVAPARLDSTSSIVRAFGAWLR